MPLASSHRAPKQTKLASSLPGGPKPSKEERKKSGKPSRPAAAVASSDNEAKEALTRTDGGNEGNVSLEDAMTILDMGHVLDPTLRVHEDQQDYRGGDVLEDAGVFAVIESAAHQSLRQGRDELVSEGRPSPLVPDEFFAPLEAEKLLSTVAVEEGGVVPLWAAVSAEDNDIADAMREGQRALTDLQQIQQKMERFKRRMDSSPAGGVSSENDSTSIGSPETPGRSPALCLNADSTVVDIVVAVDRAASRQGVAEPPRPRRRAMHTPAQYAMNALRRSVAGGLDDSDDGLDDASCSSSSGEEEEDSSKGAANRKKKSKSNPTPSSSAQGLQDLENEFVEQFIKPGASEYMSMPTSMRRAALTGGSIQPSNPFAIDADEVRRLLPYSLSAKKPIVKTALMANKDKKKEEGQAVHQSADNNAAAAVSARRASLQRQEHRQWIDQEALVEKIVQSLPSRIPEELMLELSQQRRQLEHLTQVQQEHLRRLAREQQEETRRRVQAPRVDPVRGLFSEATYSAENQRLGLHKVVEPFIAGQQLQRMAADVNQPLPPLVTIVTPSGGRIGGGGGGGQKPLDSMAEREARFYEKELQRVSTEYRDLLADEKERRRLERRAFQQVLQEQHGALVKGHKEAMQLSRREARLQQNEQASLVHRLAVAQEMHQQQRHGLQKKYQEDVARKMMESTVAALKPHMQQGSSSTTTSPEKRAAADRRSRGVPDLSRSEADLIKPSSRVSPQRRAVKQGRTASKPRAHVGNNNSPSANKDGSLVERDSNSDGRHSGGRAPTLPPEEEEGGVAAVDTLREDNDIAAVHEVDASYNEFALDDEAEEDTAVAPWGDVNQDTTELSSMQKQPSEGASTMPNAQSGTKAAAARPVISKAAAGTPQKGVRPVKRTVQRGPVTVSLPTEEEVSQQRATTHNKSKAVQRGGKQQQQDPMQMKQPTLADRLARSPYRAAASGRGRGMASSRPRAPSTTTTPPRKTSSTAGRRGGRGTPSQQQRRRSPTTTGDTSLLADYDHGVSKASQHYLYHSTAPLDDSGASLLLPNYTAITASSAGGVAGQRWIPPSSAASPAAAGTASIAGRPMVGRTMLIYAPSSSTAQHEWELGQPPVKTMADTIAEAYERRRPMTTAAWAADTNTSGGDTQPVVRPLAGCDFYYYGESLEGDYARRWQQFTDAHTHVQAISQSIADAHTASAARLPHTMAVAPMVLSTQGDKESSVRTWERTEQEAMDLFAEKKKPSTEEVGVNRSLEHRTVVTAAMKSEAQALVEARQRLERMRALLVSRYADGSRGAPLVLPTAINAQDITAKHVLLSPNSRWARTEHTAQQLVDDMTNETIHSVLGEFKEKAMFADVFEELEKYLFSLLLQHEIQTHTTATDGGARSKPPVQPADLRHQPLDEADDQTDALIRQAVEDAVFNQVLTDNRWHDIFAAGDDAGGTAAEKPLCDMLHEALQRNSNAVDTVFPAPKDDREVEYETVHIDRGNSISREAADWQLQEGPREQKQGDAQEPLPLSAPVERANVEVMLEDASNNGRAPSPSSHVIHSVGSSGNNNSGNTVRVVLDVLPLLQHLGTAAALPISVGGSNARMQVQEEQPRLASTEEYLTDVIVESVTVLPAPSNRQPTAAVVALPQEKETQKPQVQSQPQLPVVAGENKREDPAPLLSPTPPAPAAIPVDTTSITQVPFVSSALPAVIPLMSAPPPLPGSVLLTNTPAAPTPQPVLTTIPSTQTAVTVAELPQPSAIDKDTVPPLPPPPSQSAPSMQQDNAAQEERTRAEAESTRRRQREELIDAERCRREHVSDQEGMQRDGLHMILSMMNNMQSQCQMARTLNHQLQQQQQQQVAAPTTTSFSEPSGGGGDGIIPAAPSLPTSQQAATHAIRDPVTRFVFEWLKDFGDKAEECRRPARNMIDELNAAADAAGQPISPIPQQSTTRASTTSPRPASGPSSSSPLISSTNSSSFGPSGGHLFYAQRGVAHVRRSGHVRPRLSAQGSVTTRYTTTTSASSTTADRTSSSPDTAHTNTSDDVIASLSPSAVANAYTTYVQQQQARSNATTRHSFTSSSESDRQLTIPPPLPQPMVTAKATAHALTPEELATQVKALQDEARARVQREAQTLAMDGPQVLSTSTVPVVAAQHPLTQQQQPQQLHEAQQSAAPPSPSRKNWW